VSSTRSPQAPPDLWNPDLFEDGPPHAIFDGLRTTDPVYWNPPSRGSSGFWVLTRFSDTMTVSRDTTNFTSSFGFTDVQADPGHVAFFADNIMYRDPPGHTAHRSPIARMFTRNAMSGLLDRVRSIVIEVLDALPTQGEFDWVSRVAAEIPSRVVSDVLGVPSEDHRLLVEWANDIFCRDSSEETETRYQAAVQGIIGYVGPFKRTKLDSPDGNVMSVLMSTEVDGSVLTDPVLDQWFLALSQAGFETTHTLIAQGTLMLLEQRDLLDTLESTETISSATEEMLRYIAPVNFMGRTATQDVELQGKTIRAGEYVTMWYSAANRDPSAFPEPHSIDLKRKQNNHQAFGAPGSPHYCLGAHLARLEMRILLEELLARGFPYELADPAERKRGVFMNALKRLPVRPVTAATQ
jgi:cholest-4-en-3-one 26-monooxygenase